ncbi:unnamed protein product, partial [Tenebrio molitor]
SLRQCWIWPARHQEMNPSKWLYLKLAFLLVLSVFVLLVPTVINTQYRIKYSQNPSEDFALIVSYCGFVLMMTLYVVNHKRVAELMRRLSDFEDFGKPPEFDQFNTKMEFFSKLFIWYSILSILFYKCFKLYQIPDCKRERGSFEVCGLITPIWKPWNFTNNVNFSLTELMNDGFSSITFAHIVTATLACGSLESDFVNHNVQAIIHFVGWTVSIFVTCLGGQILISSSLSVSEAAYDSQWIRATPSLRKDLVLVMVRSQRELCIKAGPLNILCFSLFVSTGLNIVVIAYFSEPILTRHICERQNAARHFEDICGLVTASWMPFDISKFPNKYLFYIWQTYSIYWTYEGSAAISYLIVASMEHVLIRIWHLKSMIKNAIDTEDDESRRQQIARCMEYHIDIFELAKEVDGVYQRSLFVHVLFSGVLFGIMGFSILTVGMSIKTISLFVVWVGAAIFSSLSAQRLYDGSISIGEEVYNSNWFDRDYKFQREMITIIQRAQQPIRIHAGPFAEISNVFILTIFKTAYSYLTLLKASSK